ncbi:hypothetical protein, partial [Listeria ivanovii]|uniref:hypothetical protein n=1 Tax=Listeria ivanovii TaxID=1638 RepID=UPI003CEB8CFD
NQSFYLQFIYQFNAKKYTLKCLFLVVKHIDLDTFPLYLSLDTSKKYIIIGIVSIAHLPMFEIKRLELKKTILITKNHYLSTYFLNPKQGYNIFLMIIIQNWTKPANVR